MAVVLVTGGAGFVGANYVARRLRLHPADRVVVIDALTYAGQRENLEAVSAEPRLRFVHGDIRDAALVEAICAEERVEQIVALAAETHVDRSLASPAIFTETNVLGTQVLLEAARKMRVRRFLQVSTDEVYGALPLVGGTPFTEGSPLAPSSPYAASKAAADLLCHAYHHSFGLDVVITRASNNYGPYQLPEKLIPLMIIRALRDEPLPVYGDGKHVRDWLHVEDHCAAIELALERGRAGEIYNVGAANEHANLDIVKLILNALGKPESLIRHVTDRPGHDRRYAIDASKIRSALGWAPSQDFARALVETIEWYRGREGSA